MNRSHRSDESTGKNTKKPLTTKAQPNSAHNFWHTVSKNYQVNQVHWVITSTTRAPCNVYAIVWFCGLQGTSDFTFHDSPPTYVTLHSIAWPCPIHLIFMLSLFTGVVWCLYALAKNPSSILIMIFACSPSSYTRTSCRHFVLASMCVN